MSGSSLKSSAMRGSAWTLVGFTSSRMLRLASHLVLAWMLAPEIFGLMALVKVFMQGLTMFSDVGIGPSIIQNPRGNEPKFINTAFTIQIIRGFGLWIVTCLITLPYAWMYGRHDPEAWQLLYLLPVAGVEAVIEGFNSPALATLKRDLRLGRLTALELGSQGGALVVMITWALIHPTIWALVAGGLGGALCTMLLSHCLVPEYRVRPGWDRKCAEELFRFGKWIFLSTVFSFLAMNLDKVVLGNVISLTDLGLYSIAYVLAYLIISVSMAMGGRVLFPIYSKLQDDPSRLISVGLRARRVILWVGATACICFAIGAPLVFQTLWDDRYQGAAPIAQWMAVNMWSLLLLATMDRIPLALGNSHALFVGNMIQVSGIGFGALSYLLAGMPGFIVGLSIGPYAAHLYLLRHIPVGAAALFWQGARFSVGVLAAGACGALANHWASHYLSEIGYVVFTMSLLALTIACGGLFAYRGVHAPDPSTPKGGIRPATVPIGPSTGE